MDNVQNLLTSLPTGFPEELFEPLLVAPGLRIERIVSHGHASPADLWYDQPQGEWILLLRGAARLQFADPAEIIPLQAGDSLNIPPHRKHRVDWTPPDEPTVWLAIHHGDGAERNGP